MLGAVIVGLLGMKYHLHCLYKGVSTFINLFVIESLRINSRYNKNISQFSYEKEKIKRHN